MLPFSTEFPVKRIDNKAAFPAEVFGWLRGMQASTILGPDAESELEGENVHLVAESGEELLLRALQDDLVWGAIAFRHDMPDDQGRIWRTEAVLKRSDADGKADLLRLRTQCLAQGPGATVLSPRKPYLIKSLLNAGWGGLDGGLRVSDAPIFLKEDCEGLALAADVISGRASSWLPVVYVPATADGEWMIDRTDAEKLAYDLGGVAHVVVEPSRQFSFSLRDASAGANVYGNTIGLSLPQRGFVYRFFVGRRYLGVADVLDGVRRVALATRAQMPAFGWDWTDFQEHSLRRQRAALRGSESEASRLLDEYTRGLHELTEENKRLKEQIAARAEDGMDIGRSEERNDVGPLNVVNEIYAGEIVDRLKLAASTALTIAKSTGVDERSMAVWLAVAERAPRSPALDELLSDLARATKDPKRVATEVTGLLRRHGYEGKSENKHIRLTSREGMEGLRSITLPKTPSEWRGLKNLRGQIEGILGIGRLPKS